MTQPTVSTVPVAIVAAEAALRANVSNYPQPFLERMLQRRKRPLGDVFAIKSFGVNLTELLPGGISSLCHRHSRQEEFIFILSGTATLRTQSGDTELTPGMCAGFVPAGSAHQLVNNRVESVVYLELGTRCEGDQVAYPEDDLTSVMGEDGQWHFAHKDGRPY
jgi:uncharacterized cupin superfamily protein